MAAIRFHRALFHPRHSRASIVRFDEASLGRHEPKTNRTGGKAREKTNRHLHGEVLLDNADAVIDALPSWSRQAPATGFREGESKNVGQEKRQATDPEGGSKPPARCDGANRPWRGGA